MRARNSSAHDDGSEKHEETNGNKNNDADLIRAYPPGFGAALAGCMQMLLEEPQQPATQTMQNAELPLKWSDAELCAAQLSSVVLSGLRAHGAAGVRTVQHFVNL